MLSKDGEIERTVLTPGQLPGMEQPLSLQMFSSGIKEFPWKSNSFPQSVTALRVSPSTSCDGCRLSCFLTSYMGK